MSCSVCVIPAHFQAVTVLCVCMLCGTARPSAKPNFIVMVADDLGFGDTGIYGNTTIPTPNIDQMGRQGVVFRHSLAAASLCTPSRAALLTSRYPIRYGMSLLLISCHSVAAILMTTECTGMASPSKNRVLLFVAQSGGLPQSETTFAKILQSNGYRTGLIGKWHLGNDKSVRGDQEHHPNRHGFDLFYGMPLTNLKDFGETGESVVKSFFPHFHSFLLSLMIGGATAAFVLHRLQVARCLTVFILISSITLPLSMLSLQLSIPTINSILMRNDRVIEQPVQIEGSTARFVRESKHFMTSAMQSDQQFLLMLNFIKVHTVHKPSPLFRGKSAHGPFGDCVMELDWGVGQILDFVRDHSQLSNTLIFLTSDNGGHLEDISLTGQQIGGSNGVLRGGKGHGAVEGGIRVPTLVHWSGLIGAGREIRAPVSLMDFFPTMMEAAGLPLPTNLDGRSLIPLLHNHSLSEHHKFLFHYCGSYLHGVTYSQDESHVWKVYFSTPRYKNEHEFKCHYVCMCYGSEAVQHSPPQLYNLSEDPSERQNTAHSRPDVLAAVAEAVRKHTLSLGKEPESQFSFWNSVWRPDLQPCCNFPLCSCSESQVANE